MATEYWEEDGGEQLNLADVEAGMKRKKQLMEQFHVGEKVPSDIKSPGGVSGWTDPKSQHAPGRWTDTD